MKISQNFLPLAVVLTSGVAYMSLDDPKTPTSDTFCINPFLEINIASSGAVKPCCAFYPFISKDGRPMSVYEYSIDEIWDSDSMRAVRKSMTEGKIVEECSYCYEQERKGATSMRIDGLRAWQGGYLNPKNETIEDLKSKVIASDYKLPNGPEWIDIDVGNLCNLKCRMCNGLSSSGIANDPVHFRWDAWDLETVPRWQGNIMIIAPRRVLGVEYEGFSDLDKSRKEPVRWISNIATVRVKNTLEAVSSVQIKFELDSEQSGKIKIYANDVPIHIGEKSDLPAELHINLPTQDIGKYEFVLRIETTTPLAMGEVKLFRAQAGSTKVGLSRFSNGKQWFQEEEFLYKELFNKVDCITKINFIGGELFLIKEVRAIMKYLILLGVAKNITLSMTTNGTVVDDEICDLVAQFKSVICAVSLDGVGEVNDYIRYPSRWEIIGPNISRLKKINNAYVYANMTVQAYNMLHVVPLVQYCEGLDIDFRYHFLEYPSYLSSLIMPIEARKAAADYIRRYALSNSFFETENITRKIEIKNRLIELANIFETNNGPSDLNALNEFMIFTNDLDTNRQQDFVSINPELYQFFESSRILWKTETRYAQFGNGQSKIEKTN